MELKHEIRYACMLHKELYRATPSDCRTCVYLVEISDSDIDYLKTLGYEEMGVEDDFKARSVRAIESTSSTPGYIV